MDITVRDLMNEKEKFAYSLYIQRHLGCHSTTSVEVTPTNAGYKFICKCLGCQKPEDITDYDKMNHNK